MWRMVNKQKIFIIAVIFQFNLFANHLFLQEIQAASNDREDGFIIEADRVEGEGMFATMINQETSSNTSEPMLRIFYKSAKIYGMKLTKNVDSPEGMVSITMNANGPVTVKGMTVDTSAISFKGVCLHANETLPQVGMENVVMVAHYMNTENSELTQLMLQAARGHSSVKKPEKLQVLQNLSQLPVSQVNKGINKIINGNLPLTCGSGDGKNGKGAALLPSTPEEILKPIVNIIDITKPIEVVDKMTKPLDKITKPLKEITKPLEVITQPLKDVIADTEKTLKQTVPTVVEPVEVIKKVVTVIPVLEDPLPNLCSSFGETNGDLTKEKGLLLVDEAEKQGVPLGEVCPERKEQLLKLEDRLLHDAGVFNLLTGILSKEERMEKLPALREEMEKREDGLLSF